MKHNHGQTTGRTVVGLFARRRDAEAAIRDLKTAGFKDNQVGVALQDREEQGDLLESTGAKEAEGAAAGAVSGGLVGGLIGLLGSLLIPGALMGLGVPETDARHFDQGLRLGSTLVTVDAGPRTAEALVILDRHGMDFGPSGTERFAAFDRAAGNVGDPTMAGLDIGSSGLGMGDVASGSSTGTRGFEPSRARSPRRERRVRRDAAYTGPERRLAGGR
jgi:hypothetical protein